MPSSTSIHHTSLAGLRRIDAISGKSQAIRSLIEEQLMLDVILLAIGVGFFALSVAYAFGCDQL